MKKSHADSVSGGGSVWNVPGCIRAVSGKMQQEGSKMENMTKGKRTQKEGSGRNIRIPRIGQKMYEVQYSEKAGRFVVRESKVQKVSIHIMVHTNWIGGMLDNTIFTSKRKAVRKAGIYNKGGEHNGRKTE